MATTYDIKAPALQRAVDAVLDVLWRLDLYEAYFDIVRASPMRIQQRPACTYNANVPRQVARRMFVVPLHGTSWWYTTWRNAIKACNGDHEAILRLTVFVHENFRLFETRLPLIAYDHAGAFKIENESVERLLRQRAREPPPCTDEWRDVATNDARRAIYAYIEAFNKNPNAAQGFALDWPGCAGVESAPSAIALYVARTPSRPNVVLAGTPPNNVASARRTRVRELARVVAVPLAPSPQPPEARAKNAARNASLQRPNVAPARARTRIRAVSAGRAVAVPLNMTRPLPPSTVLRNAVRTNRINVRGSPPPLVVNQPLTRGGAARNRQRTPVAARQPNAAVARPRALSASRVRARIARPEGTTRRILATPQIYANIYTRGNKDVTELAFDKSLDVVRRLKAPRGRGDAEWRLFHSKWKRALRNAGASRARARNAADNSNTNNTGDDAMVVIPLALSQLLENRQNVRLGKGAFGETWRTRWHGHTYVRKTFAQSERGFMEAMSEQVRHIEIYARMRDLGATFLMTTPILEYGAHSLQTIAGPGAPQPVGAVQKLKTLTESQQMQIGRQLGADLALALATLHRVRATHGDLSAANMMVVADPARHEPGVRLVLIDFGLAYSGNRAETFDLQSAYRSIDTERRDSYWTMPIQPKTRRTSTLSLAYYYEAIALRKWFGWDEPGGGRALYRAYARGLADLNRAIRQRRLELGLSTP